MNKLLIIEDVFDDHKPQLESWLRQLNADFQFYDELINIDADHFFDPLEERYGSEHVRGILVSRSILNGDHLPPGLQPRALDDQVFCLRRLVDFNPNAVAYIVDDNGTVSESPIVDLLRLAEYESHGRTYRNIH